jgi:UDP-N-acetylmuramate dehydrogenase
VVVYPDLIEATVAAGLSGLEHYVGIPSTVGGALWQNLHFLSPPPERERTMFIEEVVESADLLTAENERKTVDHDYFDFGYDYSILHDRDDLVLAATFQLEPADEAGCARSWPPTSSGAASATPRSTPSRAPAPSSRRSRASAPGG